MNKAVLRRLLALLAQVNPRLRCLIRHSKVSLTFLIAKLSRTLKKEEMQPCPVATTVNLIGNKWKLLILRNLFIRPYRFNELQKSLEGISQKVLTENLRAMQECGIIERIVFDEKNKAVLRRTASLNREPLAAALSNTPLQRLAHVPYREPFSDNFTHRIPADPAWRNNAPHNKKPRELGKRLSENL